MNAYKKLFYPGLLGIILIFSGCATFTKSFVHSSSQSRYVPPIKKEINNSRLFSRNFDLAWEAVISYFAENNISIRTLEKDSGIVVAESSLDSSDDLESCVDVGYIENKISFFENKYECSGSTKIFISEDQLSEEMAKILITAASRRCKFLGSMSAGEPKLEKTKIITKIVTRYNIFAKRVSNKVKVSTNVDFNVQDKKYTAQSKGLLEKLILDYIDNYINQKHSE